MARQQILNFLIWLILSNSAGAQDPKEAPETGPPGVAPVPLLAPRSYAHEIYQDFRGRKPLVDELKLVGMDRAQACEPEEGGLRITLAKTPRSNQPTGVRLMFSLEGDFEITGTYEVLSIDMPPGGGGAGVALNVVATNNYQKFARLGRFRQPDVGNAYQAECRIKGRPSDRPFAAEPTEARSGQLRLIRDGAQLHYQVADGPAHVFREIYQAEFTDDPVEIVRLAANNNATPAGVDVRLIDLRIRYGSGPPAAAAAPAERGRFSLLLALGMLVVLLLAIVLAAACYLRRRRQSAQAPAGDDAPIEPIDD
jgi:hypothetical protein